MDSPHQCQYCERTFVRLDNCKRHEQNCLGHQEKKTKSLTCSSCDKVFTRTSSKKRHETMNICQRGHTNISANEQHAGNDIHTTNTVDSYNTLHVLDNFNTLHVWDNFNMLHVLDSSTTLQVLDNSNTFKC